MLLPLVALATGVAAGFALGGRLRDLAWSSVKAVELLCSGVVSELVGQRWASGWLGWLLVVAGFACLIAFALLNARIPGTLLVAAGLLANLAVISLDGGMPVAGAVVSQGSFHHPEQPRDRLVALADGIRIEPLGETVSAGDVVLCVGVAAVAASLMRPTGRRARRWTASQ